MKKSILAILLFAISTTFAVAQEKAVPRTEFTVELSAPSLAIKPGETKSVTINLNRSKGFAKSKAVIGLSSGLPQGITISFEPAEGVITSSVASISVAETVKPGNYMIILKSTIQNKDKGATLRLAVDGSVPNAVTKN